MQKMQMTDHGLTPGRSAVAATIDAAEEVRPSKEDEAPRSWDSGPAKADTPQNISKSEKLIELALSLDLFHTPDGRAFADVEIDGRRHTLPIKHDSFKAYLYRKHKQLYGVAPSPQVLSAAVDHACGKACHDAPEHQVYVRVARFENRIYIDLANDTGQVIEVDRSGWRLIHNPTIRFTRPKGMRPLPVPERGGNLDGLFSLLNLKTEEQRVLFVAWVLTALGGFRPYPLLILSGEQGTAKSTTSRIACQLIDPNGAPLRAIPRSEHDLYVMARNSYVLAFDNVSALAQWMPDALCRLATGGGFSTRQLYTDEEEVIFHALRPVIMNGIEDFVTKLDLADRCFFITLSPIPEDQRRTEEELTAAFAAQHPFILGALLDAMVLGLQRLPGLQLKGLPRMADAGKWIVACEAAFFSEGTFMRIHDCSRDEALTGALEADPVACALLKFMEGRPDWSGTCTELLHALRLLDQDAARHNRWPRSASALSGHLRRVEPLLRNIGITISYTRSGRVGRRTVHIVAAIRNGAA